MGETTNRGRLRPGDVVEVRSAAEILATLGPEGALGAVPFMPEMTEHVGRRFTVAQRVEKICDTAGATFSSRRMHGTVFLDDLRCDGSGHDGCGAGCRLYWKEEWLRRVDDLQGVEPGDEGGAELESVAAGTTRTTRVLDGEVVDAYRCQATDAPAATEPLRGFDPRQYAREVTCGNISAPHAVKVLGRAIMGRIRRGRRPLGPPLGPGTGPGERPAPLALQPGELVRIKSRDEIRATLTPQGKNRGLWFDTEMVPYCGRTYRVRSRVARFIDDKTGKMVELSSDCLILEGVTCSGERSSWRFFCHRAIFSWWREAWLERVQDPGDGSTAAVPRSDRGSAGADGV
jgi:hypothetical protein